MQNITFNPLIIRYSEIYMILLYIHIYIYIRYIRYVMQHSMLWYCVIRKLTVYCICALFLWQCYPSHSYRWTYFSPCYLSFYCKKFSKTWNITIMIVNELLTFSSSSNMQITLTLHNAHSYKSFWSDKFFILYLQHAILIILSNNLQLCSTVYVLHCFLLLIILFYQYYFNVTYIFIFIILYFYTHSILL